jgi:hypothetical protein
MSPRVRFALLVRMTTRVIAKAKPEAIQKVHTYAPLDCFTAFAMTDAI